MSLSDAGFHFYSDARIQNDFLRLENKNLRSEVLRLQHELDDFKLDWAKQESLTKARMVETFFMESVLPEIPNTLFCGDLFFLYGTDKKSWYGDINTLVIHLVLKCQCEAQYIYCNVHIQDPLQRPPKDFLKIICNNFRKNNDQYITHRKRFHIQNPENKQLTLKQ